jgi:hypothetical protein
MSIRHLASMVIRNFHIVGITIDEPETDAPLVIDSNRILPSSISSQLVEPISWRNPEVI